VFQRLSGAGVENEGEDEISRSGSLLSPHPEGWRRAF